ncbi:MAG: lipase family protein [Actinomycetota bacterium]
MKRGFLAVIGAKALIAGLVLALMVMVLSGAAEAAPLMPDADPFYRPPASLASYAPGAIIRSREVETSLGPLPTSVLGAKSYQLLYRTNDPESRPIANVTTLLVPIAPKLSGGRELVSLQDAEDSLTTNCAPSYQLQVGEQDNADMLAEFTAAAPTQIAAGRTLLIPDPYGPQSEFLVTRMEAFAILDSIRAAERFPAAQLDGVRTPVVLIGYSGGGHETMAAAELQHTYAPELKIVGAAAGGTPAGDDETFRYFDGREGSGVVMGAMIALERAYPSLGWSSLLNDYGRSVAARMEKGPGCVTPVVSGQDHIADWTTVPDPLGVPRIAREIAANALGSSAPIMPTFLYVSQHDELISLSDSDKLAARYCEGGTQLDYYRDPIEYQGPLGDHTEAAILGFIPRALAYANDRFAGSPAPTTCAPTAAGTKATPSPSSVLGKRTALPATGAGSAPPLTLVMIGIAAMLAIRTRRAGAS